jgi:hypothetical protein
LGQSSAADGFVDHQAHKVLIKSHLDRSWHSNAHTLLGRTLRNAREG